MNWLVKLLFLSCFINSQLQAREVCFQFVLESFGSAETAKITQDAEFLEINGKGIGFKTTHIENRNGYIQVTTNRGCINSAYLFDRPNELVFTIATGDGKSTKAELVVDLYVETSANKVNKLFRHTWPKGTPSTNFGTTRTFTLKELDPEKAGEIEKNKKWEKRKKEREEHHEKINESQENREKKKAEHERFIKAHQKEHDIRVASEKDKLNKFKKETGELIEEGNDLANEIFQDLLKNQENEPLDPEQARLNAQNGIKPQKNCFTAETLVLVADKYSFNPKTKRIDEISTEDYVWSCDNNSAYCVKQQVNVVYSHQVDSIVSVTINGITVDSTPDHLFYRWNEFNQTGSWIPAIGLESGDELISINGQQVFVDEVEFKSQTTIVYNFGVDSDSGSHNYYITDLGILVHNCGNEPGSDIPQEQLGTGSIIAGAEALEFAAELGVDVVDVLAMAAPAKVPAAIVKMGKNAVKRYVKGMLKDKIATVKHPKSGKMLGQNGAQTTSKTIWKGKGKERIDVENPNPGQRPGQIHYQDNQNNKYLYDPNTNTFKGAPKKVNDLLKDPSFKKAIDKGMKQYLGEL